MPVKSSRQRTPDVIDTTPAISEDKRLVTQDGDEIQTFLAGAAGFFLLAGTIEKAAAIRLSQAKALEIPTTEALVATIQQFIRATAIEKKVAIEHWSVKQLFGRLHKRCVAAEHRAIGPLDEAQQIGNRLHNGYVEAEQRRAAEEQDRVRRAAEAQARLDRERELAQLEAEAVAREEGSADLSEREQLFVGALVSGSPQTRGNGQAAAESAGYKDPFAAAARLLSRPKIQAAIAGAQEALAIRAQVMARKDEPLDVQVEIVRPQISTAGGHDRTTHGYEILDANLFIEAFRSGRYGIPTNCVQPAPAGLLELARSLHDRLNMIPGLRYVKKTSVI